MMLENVKMFQIAVEKRRYNLNEVEKSETSRTPSRQKD